jgi:hypothetical protein
MAMKVKWVEVVVTGAKEQTSGNCTTYTGTHSTGKVSITNTLGKTIDVSLANKSTSVTVCDDTGVATVKDE